MEHYRSDDWNAHGSSPPLPGEGRGFPIPDPPDSGDNVESGLVRNFKRFFIRGLAALLPTLVTIAILIWAYELVHRYIGSYLTDGFITMLARTDVPAKGDLSPLIPAAKMDALKFGTPTDEFMTEEDGGFAGRFKTREFSEIEYLVPPDTGPKRERLRQLIIRLRQARYDAGATGFILGLIGFLVAIMLVWVIGVALATFVGRRTWPRIEAFVTQLPVVKAIYPHVKQVTDFVLAEKNLEGYSSVIVVEYPRKGLWSVGLLTGDGMRQVDEAAGAATVSVFIPSSPTPFTGYVISVRREDVLFLPISIDDALRFTVSGGVIKPPSQLQKPLVSELTRAVQEASASGEAQPVSSAARDTPSQL